MLRVLGVRQVQEGPGVLQYSLCCIWSWRGVLEVLGVRAVLVCHILGLQVNRAPQGAQGVPSECLPWDPQVQVVRANQAVPKSQPLLCRPSLLSVRPPPTPLW